MRYTIHSRIAYPIVSRILGLVLLVAGFLKSSDLGDARGWFGLTSLTAFGEMALGCWLLAGALPQMSWWITAGCFVTFLGISFDRLMSGELSCGCFGRVTVNPRYTVLFDVAAILALAWVYPYGQAGPRPHRRIAVWLGVSTVVFGGIYVTRPNVIDASDGVEAAGPDTYIVANPDEWIGLAYPLTKSTDIGPQLLHGQWVVVFHRAKCEKCREALPAYVALSRHFHNRSASTRVAFVEIPPFETNESTINSGVSLHHGRLSGERRWRMNVPYFLVLEEGIVTQSSSNPDQVLAEFGIGRSNEARSAGYLFPDYKRVRRDTFLREIACGPLAMIEVLSALGKPVSDGERDLLIAKAGMIGVDLSQLKDMAEERGLHSLGAAVSTRKLKQSRMMAIVRLNDVGFAAVTGFTDDGVRVVLPLRPAILMPDEMFAKEFGPEGYALFVSREPLHVESLGLGRSGTKDSVRTGPRLRISRSLLTAGCIHRSRWQAEVTLTNDGDGPLEIASVRSSNADFLTASLDQTRLAPGDSTMLRARGTRDRLGSFTYFVTLETNDPSQSIVRLPVRGYVEQPVGFERPTGFQRVTTGQPFTERVELDVPLGLSPERLHIEAVEDASIQVRVEQSAGRSALVIECKGIARTGWYRWPIRVYAEKGERRLSSEFHMTAEILPTVEIVPSSGIVSNDALEKEWQKRFRVKRSGNSKGHLTTQWQSAELNRAIHVEIAEVTDNVFEVTLRPTREWAQVRFKGMATLQIGDSTEMSAFRLYLGDESLDEPGKHSSLKP